MAKVEVYECSDGFLTKSEGVYKRREKVLKKYKKIEENMFTHLSFEKELKEASLSDEDYKAKKYQDKINALYILWRTSKPEYICSTCKGTGYYDWEDEGYGATRYYTEQCKSCNCTGLSKEATVKYDNDAWYKEAKKLK